MNQSSNVIARIQFLIHTHGEYGEIIHAPGDVVVGTVLGQRQDFLFVQPDIGPCICIDTSRCDWHNVELERSFGGGL